MVFCDEELREDDGKAFASAGHLAKVRSRRVSVGLTSLFGDNIGFHVGHSVCQEG